jgi:Putative transposase of IS4/5 family (DUF4096)
LSRESKPDSPIPLGVEGFLSRGDLSEAKWRLLRDLLPAERGRKARPAHDNRLIVDGILWRIHTGVHMLGMSALELL